MEILSDFENDDFYTLTTQLGRQAITNPYSYHIAGREYFLATISAPIYRGNQIVGIVGLDVNLEDLNVLGQDTRDHFPGTMYTAFSSNGTIVSHPDTSKLAKNMRETERDFLGSHLSVVENAVYNSLEHQVDIDVNGGRGGRFRVFTVPIRISDFPNAWSISVAMPMNEVNAETYSMIKFAVIIIVVILVLIQLSSLLVSRSVVKPITNMTGMLYNIAQGNADLTQRLPEIGKDEITDASRYFNRTMSQFRNLVVSIKENAETLSATGEVLASNMTETAAAMNEISSNIQSMKQRIVKQSASVTQTGATMAQVTENIDELSGHVDRQTYAVAQASTAIEQMLANIKSVTSTLVKNTDNMKSLRESSETGKSSLQEVAGDISEIARESEGLLEINALMENIASQTNLLSMNAAIEAAHAGESGKGFAVVADEIRKLAESSSLQSKTIGTVLKKIKGSIDKITRSTDNVLHKFEAIDDGVKTVSEQSDTILYAMEEQGEGSRQVLDASTQVSEITRQVKGGSTEMLGGSREVIQESKRLESVTQEIANSITEMALGVDHVNVAVNNVNELSVKNRENISSLTHAVSQFKV